MFDQSSRNNSHHFWKPWTNVAWNLSMRVRCALVMFDVKSSCFLMTKLLVELSNWRLSIIPLRQLSSVWSNTDCDFNWALWTKPFLIEFLEDSPSSLSTHCVMEFWYIGRFNGFKLSSLTAAVKSRSLLTLSIRMLSSSCMMPSLEELRDFNEEFFFNSLFLIVFGYFGLKCRWLNRSYKSKKVVFWTNSGHNVLALYKFSVLNPNISAQLLICSSNGSPSLSLL